MSQKKVLIADDEPNILISLEFLMKREGHQVLVARSGTEALEAIIRERLLSIARHADRVALALHQVLERNQDVRLVVGDQNLLAHAGFPCASPAVCHGNSNAKQAPSPGAG